jgi:hypothetical protein
MNKPSCETTHHWTTGHEITADQRSMIGRKLLLIGREASRAANYCRTSDNVRLNLANVRAKVILIGHWSDHKKKLSHYTFFCCDKIRLQIHSICILQ